MKSKFVLIIFFIVLKRVGLSQNDSLICDMNCKMIEGIYTNYEDFRRNNPITKNQIESNLNKEQLDFFGKVLESEKISYTRNDQKFVAASKTVWGYYQNNALHINYKGKFYRVPLFGSISYLMATVEVITNSYYPGGYGGMGMGGMGMGGSYKTTEIRDFLLNFYDGILVPFWMELAEKLLSRDQTIYNEFKDLRHKQQKEQVSRYIRKYNEAHPVYFLK